jgi:epoxyqueuosine reductase
LPDFDERAQWSDAQLLELWRWDEASFLRHTEGSALRRIGFARWQRNLAVALGNALRAAPRRDIEDALRDALPGADDLLREHVLWALEQAVERQRSADSAASASGRPGIASNVDTVTRPDT